MFLLFLLCEKIWGLKVSAVLWNSGRMLHWNHQPMGSVFYSFYFWFGLLMTASISLQVIGLFKLFIGSWLNFDMWYLSRKFPFLLHFPILGVQVFEVWPNHFLKFFSVCCYVPLLFLILLIWMFSLCLLVSLDKDLSILLIFSKNQLFVSLILCIVLFVLFYLFQSSIWLFPVFNSFWVSLLLFF